MSPVSIRRYSIQHGILLLAVNSLLMAGPAAHELRNPLQFIKLRAGDRRGLLLWRRLGKRPMLH